MVGLWPSGTVPRPDGAVWITLSPAPQPVAPGPAALAAVAPPQAALLPPRQPPSVSPVVTEGLLMFRGNPQRNFYGTGPLGTEFKVAWRYPDKPMCAPSSARGETKTWCGTGWTGQPAIWRRPDGRMEVVVGAFDRAVHFVDLATGLPTRPPFPTGDLVKGSVTIDPDGHPLLYFGSRDRYLRIVALDRPEPALLWRFHASEVRPTIWSLDWDGNPVVQDGVLYTGGENGWFLGFRLNRARGPDGLVTVAPERVVAMPAWDQDLLRRTGDRNVAIESSVALKDGIAYLANSGGRVLGLDLRRVEQGRPAIVLDWWGGDDIDATPVIDRDGSLYVAIERKRALPRGREVGQVVKIDPRTRTVPWAVDVTREGWNGLDGVWSTPALGRDALYVTTHRGLLLAIDKAQGTVLWQDEIGFHPWSSPALIGDRLLVSTCTPGGFRVYDVSRPGRNLIAAWTLASGGCVESTPAVWQGTVVVGARDGYLRAIATR